MSGLWSKKSRSSRKRRRQAVTHTLEPTRLAVIKVCFVLMAMGILFRAYHLQMTRNDPLQKIATRQHDRTITYRAPRGSILDRNEKQLAVSLPMQSAYINPREVRNPKALAKKIAQVLHLSEKKLQKDLSADRYFSWIKRQASPQEIEKLKSLIPDLLGSIKESRRFYPQKTLAAHVLGFIGSEGNGLEGLELRFEEILNGGKRSVKLAHDANGHAIDFSADMVRIEDLTGNDVVLTLDSTIQHFVERELETAVTGSKAKAGNIVVMDPQNGDILAIANFPTYDPNEFSKAESETKKNRALVDVFEPGSLFKVFVIGKALEQKLVSLNEKINCENGSYRVKGVTIHDVKSHGLLSVSDVLKYSSNIGVFKIAERFSPQVLYQAIRDFGFGEKTGVALSGEARGIVKPPDQWYGVTQGNIGFGQGIAATTFQLARAYAAIANGGTLLKPRLVHAIMGPKGNILQNRENRQVLRQSLSPKWAAQLTSMMVGVTQEGGSGVLAALNGYSVAGKTGTSQKPDGKGGYSKERYVSSFVGFVPAEEPKLVIAVVIDEPQGEIYGGMVAAPVFRKVAEQSLLHLGVKPDPKLIAKGIDGAVRDPVLAVSRALAVSGREHLEVAINRELSALVDQVASRMPDVRGLTLREALANLNELNLRVKITGNGVIMDQKPLPGEPLRKNAECVLFAKPLSRTEAEQNADFSSERVKKRI